MVWIKRTAAGLNPIDCFTHFYQRENAEKVEFKSWRLAKKSSSTLLTVSECLGIGINS